MSTTYDERKVLFLMGKGLVPADVTGHGAIKVGVSKRTGLVLLSWVEFRGEAMKARRYKTGLTLDEFAEEVGRQ